MYSSKWSEKAAERLIQIADYIALDAPKAAIKWTNTIISKEEIILENPKIGRIVPEIGKEAIRELIIGNYRLIYEIHDNTIIFLTIMNCRELIFNIIIE